MHQKYANTSETTMQQRDEKIDNIKGALMLLVIFGHMIEPLINADRMLSDIYNFVYLFHIPAFVLLSGYLSGYSSSIKWNSLMKGIIIPLLMFSVIYELPDLLNTGNISGYLKSLTPNWLLWFLVSMFFWRLLTPLVMMVRFAIPFSILLSILISLTSVDGYTYGVFRTVIFFPFYLTGVMLNSQREKFESFKVKHLLSLGSLALLVSIPLMNLPFNRYFLYGVAPFGAFGYSSEMGIIQRIEYYPIAFITIILFSFAMANCKMFGVIGKNSLYVYLWHGLIVKYYFWPQIISSMPVTWKAIALAVTVSLLLGYLLSTRYVVTSTNFVIDVLYRLLVRQQLKSVS